MKRVSLSEEHTRQIASDIAKNLFQNPAVFIHLKGPLGVGKSTFARGFIKAWLELSKEPQPQTIVSPTFTLVQVYGKNKPIAHLDLYRLKSFAELEQLDYEQYFYNTPACLVEWLEQIPGANALFPDYGIIVELQFGKQEGERKILLPAPNEAGR